MRKRRDTILTISKTMTESPENTKVQMGEKDQIKREKKYNQLKTTEKKSSD